MPRSTSLSPDEVNQFVARVYPATRELGFRCDAIGDGFAQVRWAHDAAALRPGGLISGPTQFTAADLALWCLSFTVVGLAPMAVTADLHIVFLRPASGGDLLARADLLRAGRSRIVGRVSLWIDGAEARPVSHASGTYALLVPS